MQKFKWHIVSALVLPFNSQCFYSLSNMKVNFEDKVHIDNKMMLVYLLFQSQDRPPPPNFRKRCAIHLVMLSGDQSPLSPPPFSSFFSQDYDLHFIEFYSKL